MATPSHLRQINQRGIIRAMLRLGAASRAGLAKATGMSQPTAGKIVEELLAAGILEEAVGDSNGRSNGAQGADAYADPGYSAPASPAFRETVSGRMGRPGQLVQLDHERPRFLAIQLGVLHTRLAMLPVAIQDSDDWGAQISTGQSSERWVERVAKAAEGLMLRRTPADRAVGRSRRRPNANGVVGRGIRAVLLSVPGVVDERSGRALLCPNLRWAEKVNLLDLLRGWWEGGVAVVQEIRALALGHLAVERSGGDFLLVDFGDGVGGAAVVEGSLFESTIPLSGELGHTPVLGNTRPCGCGAVGCVETLVSRPGLLASFAGQSRCGPHTWGALVRDVRQQGLRPWLTSALDAAAMTIAGAINVLGVRRVIITGCLTELGQPVIAYVSDAIRRGAMWARLGQVTCEGAPRRRMAGLVSAAIDRILVPLDQEGMGAGIRDSERGAWIRKPPASLAMQRGSSNVRPLMAGRP